MLILYNGGRLRFALLFEKKFMGIKGSSQRSAVRFVVQKSLMLPQNVTTVPQKF